MNHWIKNRLGQVHLHSLGTLVHENVDQFFILWLHAYHIFDPSFGDW